MNNVQDESNFFGGDELKVKFNFNCQTDAVDEALVCWRVTWRDASGFMVASRTVYIESAQGISQSTDYLDRSDTFTAASNPPSQYTATIFVGTYSIINGNKIPAWQDSYEGVLFTYE